MLVENQHQGHLAPSQRVVAACRLPWPFKVGKPQHGQGTPAGPAGGTVPEASVPSGRYHMAVDTPTPRARVGAEPGVPTVETLIPPSPESSSLSEGEYKGVLSSPSSNTQAPSAHDPRAKEVAGSKQRKRDRVEAGLDDGDPQNSTEGRRVRRVPNTGPAGPCASAAYQSPTAPQLDPLLRPVQGHQSSPRPVESTCTVLCSVNPRKGPVSGGTEVWLAVDDLPTTFTLYARFGTQVAATVSPIFLPLLLI